jgi:glycosyltransferase involved in cell wall biosynthesis/GT2 family glycosyltransferase
MNAARVDIEALRRDVVVCVLFFNRLEQTLECIRSFLPSGVAVHVLDNGSEPAAVQAMAEALRAHPQVRLRAAGGNRGVSGGRNIQVADTTQRWLLFVDNDITVATPDWLARLARHVADCPQAEVHVPRLYNKHENGWGYLADYLVDEAGRCTFIPTASDFGNSFPGGASVIDRRLFDRLGPYDEDLFVGFEDFEFAIRAWKRGLPVLARRADDIVLIHDHRVSRSAADKETAKVRYDASRITRSHSVVQSKHGVLLDPNFSDWLADQIHQVTGERSGMGAVAPARVAAHPFEVRGTTVTPVHCRAERVLALVPVGEHGRAASWLRLRALARARARAVAAGLDVRVRALADRPGPALAAWLDDAREAGLVDEKHDARTADGRLSIGPLGDSAHVAWIGAGLVSNDWLLRSVQTLQCSPDADGLVVHPATLLLADPVRDLRVDLGDADPLLDARGASGRWAFVARAGQWRRFDTGHYADVRSDLDAASRGWLYESGRCGARHAAQGGTALLLPLHGPGSRADAAPGPLPETAPPDGPWDPWLWFEQHNMAGVARHLAPMHDWATLPTVRVAVRDPRPPEGVEALIERFAVEGVDHLLLLPWLRRGGADKAALCYLRALSQRSHGRVLALTTEPVDSTWQRFAPDGATVVDWTAVAPWPDTAASLDALTMLAVRTRVRTLHVMNSHLGWQLLAERGERLRSFARLYASLFWYGPSREDRLLGYAAECLPAAVPHLDTVITDNRTFGERLARDYGYPRDLFRCVYHPVEHVADAPLRPADGAPPRVLWASRFAPEKLPAVLLAVARELPQVEFLVYGEPPHDGTVEAALASELGTLPNVRMNGSFDGFGSLPAEGCAAFLYTSSSDGMPNVVVEAMAAGLPVVAPEVGGIAELVDETTGWPVRAPADANAYRDALRAALSDAEAARSRAAAGLERIRERHRFDGFVAQLRAVRGYLAW